MSWTVFPYANDDFTYAGTALKQKWDRLHAGDGEPYPSEKKVQDAWRAHHAGDFAKARELGLAAGEAGANVANKATMIYATYLESDEDQKQQLFLDVVERAAARQASHPDDANAFYFHAYALGRYSQSISVAKALAQGLGGKIKESLDKALELNPDHADAHIALATWHAEIIDKVGGLVGGLTYGAKKDLAIEHFDTALRLNPTSAITRIEYANAQVMMFGKIRMKDALALYAEAKDMPPADAMERLDQQLAIEELAD
ncbi:hypothetical protein KSF73_07995 [Burkholderiaceae bacterium DAT-1]|nr:hypothetical protein [Burkholderiaceae bacterium DAT-1]